MTTAKLIRRARRAKKWSQADLARQLKVGRSTVHAWEHGGPGPKRKRLVEIAAKLDVEVAELLG